MLYGSRRKTESPRRELKAEGVSWSCATLSRTARAVRLFLVAAAGPANAELFQHHFQRAEICERRLQQVEAHERGEPEPVGAVVMREQQAGEDEYAGEPSDDHVHFHIVIVFNLLTETGRKQHTENCAVNRADDRIAG